MMVVTKSWSPVSIPEEGEEGHLFLPQSTTQYTKASVVPAEELANSILHRSCEQLGLNSLRACPLTCLLHTIQLCCLLSFMREVGALDVETTLMCNYLLLIVHPGISSIHAGYLFPIDHDLL